ncbi:MAG: hypothetical protein FJ086_17395 [Deltaproteobacteria bacterium]|nr:hypothetical protein [Deltaproteobacteria bacterium]
MSARAAVMALGLLPAVVLAADTQTLPKGTFLLDTSYMDTRIGSQWDGQRRQVSLLPSIDRYEPGGGFQGRITARPRAHFQLVIPQLSYGVTDELTVAVVVPLVVRTTIDTNLSWEPGAYQPQLGRAYSEADFWAWAGSMGQPKPPDTWVGNAWTPADLVVGARYKLPRPSWLEQAGVVWAGGLYVALPTGRPVPPEEVVAAGTTNWELHSYGDVEAHLAVSKSLWTDGSGVERLVLGADGFYAWFRPKAYETPKGTNNPLLQTFAPYVGDRYTLDPGDWLGASATLDWSVFHGPTRASIVSGGSLERAERLPSLLTLSLGYTVFFTGQSDWQSQSALWDYDREKYWQPGEKHIARAQGTVSLLRLGLPIQLYAGYRNQSWLTGRYVRPSNACVVGARVLAKF